MAIDFEGTKRIYGRFQPDEPPTRSEYVDFNGLRGDPIIEPLAAEIAFADHPLTRMFSGGRGVGKTTELDRLKDIFEGKGYIVVSMDADRSIDVNNADFPDVLVFMALHLIQELDEQRALAPFANAVRTAREKLGEALRVINPTVDPKSVELVRASPRSRLICASAVRARRACASRPKPSRTTPSKPFAI